MTPIRRFVSFAAPIALAILIVAVLWRDAQVWLYRALIAIAAVALWPLGFFALAFLVALVMGLVSHGSDEGIVGQGIAELGFWASRRWFGFLWRLRHPVAWGIGVGLLAGTLLGMGAVAAIRAPRDARTLRILDEIAARDDASFATIGAGTSEVLDGYARPIRVARSRHMLMVRYELRSAGYDGHFDSEDDLCVVRRGDFARKANAFLARHEWTTLFDELRASACAPAD